MLDSIIILSYFLINISVAIYYGAKNAKGYFEVSKKYSLTTLTATMFATAVGGSTLIMLPDKFNEFGMKFFVMLGGNYISQLVIALFVVTKMKKWLGCLTPSDVISDIFSPKLKLLCGFCSAFVSIGFVAVQLHAFGKTLHYFYGFKMEYIVIMCSLLVIIYTAWGGLNSVIRTEMFQFCVIIIGVTFLTKMGLNSVGGLSELFAFLPAYKIDWKLNSIDDFNYFLNFILVGFNPSFLQRVFIAKNITQARDASLLYNFLAMIFFLVIGICGLIVYLHDPSITTMVIPYLSNLILPPGIKGLIIAAILAAIMSTAESDLNIASVSLYRDVFKKKANQTNIIFVKWLAFMLGILAIIIALAFDNIIDILFFVIDFWAVTFMFPLIFGILGIVIDYKKLYVVIIASIAAMCIYQFSISDKLISANIIGCMVNIIAYLGFYFYKRYVYVEKAKKVPTISRIT